MKLIIDYRFRWKVGNTGQLCACESVCLSCYGASSFCKLTLIAPDSPHADIAHPDPHRPAPPDSQPSHLLLTRVPVAALERGGGGEVARGAGARRRWVPPSALRRLDPQPDGERDGVFRKVRGILNKLTPEKFHKLSDDLLALHLDSDKVLKGVILLIFEKALDEPKYSSMYAQLCKRLAEEAPNLEPPGQPCTFKLLLLNKCRAEFENRAQAFAAYEDAPLAPDDHEKRHLAKCKMLGNIKFIGELGKLEILSESILHRCIQNLLARRAAADHHEDLECLAQLVRTCGRVLDSERGRRLMDQYFARIETLARSPDLAPRIRFMLRDVAELRRGGWVPRAAVSAEGPVPMAQLRDDDQPRREPLFRRARPLDEVLAHLHLQPDPLLAPPDKLFPGAFRQRGARQPLHFAKPAPHAPAAAPRAKARLAPPTSLHDVQMRPAANSLMFTANRLSKPPAPQHQLAPAFASAATPIVKEPAITIKPASDKKDKPKKDKGTSKEEACRLAAAAVDALHDAPDEPPPQLAKLHELPDKLLRRAVSAAFEHALAGAEPDAACRLVLQVKRATAADALRALAAAPLPPAQAQRLPALLAHAVHHKLAPLAEVGAWCEAPRLLEVLQALAALEGPEALRRLCEESKVNVCALAGGADGEAGATLEALEARGLGALVPQLRVRAALARQLAAEPAPQPLYRWIKANVEAGVRGSPAFVSALAALVAEHVTAEAGSAGAGADKAALERERALVEAFAPLLTALLEGRAELQLAAVYAVQVHAHKLRYPKGLLLRWFMYLYNLEVCEEEAFLRWREDVTDAYPGKGEALFQVNTWLTWLQQQDSDEEDADD